MLMTHIMNENIRPFIVKANTFDIYTRMQTYCPQGSEQRVEILETIKTISDTDMNA